jgi:Abortive infection C-terminus
VGRANELLDKVERLQNVMVAQATGGAGDEEYSVLREELMKHSRVGPALPRFVRTCRDALQFWQFIKHEFSTYAERRQFLWDAFRPLIEDLESGGTPGERDATAILKSLTDEAIHEVWERALSRRVDDPEGAITTARTLLETVCKRILDAETIEYPEDGDLPKLYKLTAETLKLAPSQHSEQVFKQILGGCTAVIEGLGALRNRLGDAHGKGKKSAKPSARHAQLAVNLSGSTATFLLATWEARKGT